MSMLRGFLVHTYPDRRRNRMFSVGRADDGRSFAVSDTRFEPSLLAECAAADLPPALASRCSPSPLVSFASGGPLLRIAFGSIPERSDAAAVLRRAGIPGPDIELKPADAYLIERGIRGPVVVEGQSRPGRNVDIVFPDPTMLPGPPDLRAPLRIASIDIETDEADGSIRAVALAAGTLDGGAIDSRVFFEGSEQAMLTAFQDAVLSSDPDILTGWNFLDFDFPRLASRFEILGLPFRIGRSAENARFLPGDSGRSAAAFVPGRQVMDALRAVRSGAERFPDYRLETVSLALLGKGKLVSFAESDDKIALLDRLYAADRAAFAEYCRADAELVLRILDKTGLFRLAVERAALTGVSLDKAWTSVASFERIYAAELRKGGIAPISPDPARRVSGAAGGTILEPQPGLFRNVAVFDFRSLYPTIIRTFNIDPLSNRRAPLTPDALAAPNGASFSREKAILPELIASYFAARRAALDAGDENAAYVYKILMNSFYGVLGSERCRYARTELAGAITSFARKWLHFSRDWFTGRGLRVLYGDTDSLFVETKLGDDAGYAAFSSCCADLASSLNAVIGERVRSEYALDSFMEIRFEKAYRRFLIPPLRASGADDGPARGRAKGYAGLLLAADGTERVEVKGMEAVRSDATAFARDAQLGMLSRVFAGAGPDAVRAYLADLERRLRSGELDASLVYRKRLYRPPEAYVAVTPPHVKVARALGWKGRRGTVEYVWTLNGPEPAAAPSAPLDYDHYLASQLKPVAAAIAAAAGFDIGPADPQRTLEW